MSLSFYELGSPPPRVDNITVEAIIERTKREDTDFFRKLERLIKQEWVRWGAVGIITCADTRRERYTWHYRSSTDSTAVDDFITEVEAKPSEYLLIGNLAAYQFRLGLPMKCIVMSKDAHADRNDVLFGTWHEPNLLRRFISSDVPEPELKMLSVQWERYVSLVATVTRKHQDAIIYVPVIAQRPRGSREETILAGGLIWCVARENVGKALGHVAEAQLYLRWHLAELFGRNPLLGLSNDFIDIDHVIAERGWFNGSRFDAGLTTVPHNWCDFHDSGRAQETPPAELIRLAHHDLEKHLHCAIPMFDPITHAALKQLYAGTVSFTALYLIGTMAMQQKLQQQQILEPSNLADQGLLPIRAKVGRQTISRHVRSNFFQFISATTISTKTSQRILESIDVSGGALTVTYDDPVLAQELAYKLDRIFSGMEKNDAPHDTSGPLSEFIMWSGSDFNSDDCIYQHQNLCVLLRQERKGDDEPKSVLRIRTLHY